MGKFFVLVAILLSHSAFAADAVTTYQCRPGTIEYYEEGGALHNGWSVSKWAEDERSLANSDLTGEGDSLEKAVESARTIAHAEFVRSEAWGKKPHKKCSSKNGCSSDLESYQLVQYSISSMYCRKKIVVTSPSDSEKLNILYSADIKLGYEPKVLMENERWPQ